jgi:hypothetical protein
MERFSVPTKVLLDFPDDTILLVRLGALANAIASVASMQAGSLATGVGHERDILQSLLLLVSYLKEATDIVDNKRAWELIAAGVTAGYRLPKPPRRSVASPTAARPCLPL